MSDEKKYTERDLILAKREGYMRHCEKFCARINKEDANVSAVVEYPLPKVTRPRVVRRADGCELRLSGTELQYRRPGNEWYTYNGMYIDENNRSALLDLLANPTEEVDA